MCIDRIHVRVSEFPPCKLQNPYVIFQNQIYVDAVIQDMGLLPWFRCDPGIICMIYN